jgi:hypothetical protein
VSELDGVRDPDFPCTLFEETGLPFSVVNDCDGDGHYLCRRCMHYSNRRMAEDALYEKGRQP